MRVCVCQLGIVAAAVVGCTKPIVHGNVLFRPVRFPLFFLSYRLGSRAISFRVKFCFVYATTTMVS